MKKSQPLGQQIFQWLPFALTIVLFIYAVMLKNDVPAIGEESKEVAQTSTYLDSPASLKTLITTLDRRVQYAAAEWDYALNISLFALFLATIFVAGLWFMHLAAQRKITQLEEELRHKHDRDD